MTSISGYQAVHDDSPGSPLLGPGFSANTSRERLVNWAIGFITTFIVFFTVISAFVYDKNTGRGLNVSFAIVICMICCSHLLLILWYRQGGVDSKFKVLIYFNALCLTLLCIFANVYFHVGCSSEKPNSTISETW